MSKADRRQAIRDAFWADGADETVAREAADRVIDKARSEQERLALRMLTEAQADALLRRLDGRE